MCLLAAAAGSAGEVLQSPYARFVLSTRHGNIVSATAPAEGQSSVSSEQSSVTSSRSSARRRGASAAGASTPAPPHSHTPTLRVLGECLDQYLWLGTDGEVRSSEADDQVVQNRRDGGELVLVCRNDKLGQAFAKRYRLVDGGRALAKTVVVGALAKRGELRVRSAARLADEYLRGAFYYTPRQSWTSPTAERNLFGVQPASRFTSGASDAPSGRETVSGAGWDNRFVVAFREGAPALGHYRWAVRDQHVMPSCVVGAYGAHSAQALTYTPTGWHFQLLHTLDGEKAPVSATAHYMIAPGDFLDVWRRYRAMPEHRAWEERPVPQWASECKAGGFWNMSPGHDQAQVDVARATAERLAGKYLPLGVFAWCLDGDYETEKPFLNEPGTLLLTPEYMRARVAEFQADPHIRLGLYFQGSLIESLTSAYRKHPEWAIQTAEGKPFFSGFRDNAAGYMHFFNPLDGAWGEHYRARLAAVCRAYNPGWIYCDGGAAIETTDYRMRRPILPDTWNDFYRRQQDAARKTGPERAVLLNAQCWPYGDLYWLECSYFGAGQPWREALEFCFDTKVLHTPQRTMLPLYWADDSRYLALCIAFGFTPCTSGKLGGWDERTWRAIDCAYAMRRASLVLSSRAVSPVWWQGDPNVVCFAERVGDAVVVPVLNFSDREKVRVTVDCAEAGVKARSKVWIVYPFEAGKDEELGAQKAQNGKLAFDLAAPKGFGGLRLLVLGSRNII